TRLGVSRQSAWERWRDVDEDTGSEEVTTFSGVYESTFELDDRAQLIEELERRGRRIRRRNVVAPNVLGTTWEYARNTLSPKGLGTEANGGRGRGTRRSAKSA